MATFSGAWVVHAAGEAASLSVSGENVPLETTTVRALWTSKPFVPKLGIALTVRFDTELDGITVPGQRQDFTVQVRYRKGSSAWTRWDGRTTQYNELPLVTTTKIEMGSTTVEFRRPEKVPWQFQVRVIYVAQDTSRETETISVSTTR